MSKIFRLLTACTFIVVLATSSIALGQTWTSIDYPGAIQTYLYGGPNPEGTSIGSWQDSSLAWHGFTYKNGAFKSFDAPGSPACNAGAAGIFGTSPAWITPQGEIVGAWSAQSRCWRGIGPLTVLRFTPSARQPVAT